jgi:hypothetical protein
MGVVKVGDVYYARKVVPPKLQRAVSRVLGAPKARVSWLKRSLRTKDQREANIRAKPVLMEFDRILAKAEGLLEDTPERTSLRGHEIERLASYHFASVLNEDEVIRQEGTGSEEMFLRITQELEEAGVDFWTPFARTQKPAFGLSDREMYKLQEDVQWMLPARKAALAKGDISFVQEEVDDLLDGFRINLDRKSSAYRGHGGVEARRGGAPGHRPAQPRRGRRDVAGCRTDPSGWTGWHAHRRAQRLEKGQAARPHDHRRV